jgi:GntR family transcriptional regulator
MSIANNQPDPWRVEYNSGIPVYRQIINQACAAVAAGRFKEGDQLPTIHALSGCLNVNPNTVAKAYRELELKGIIVSERGSGSFIQARPPASAAGARKKKDRIKNLYQRLLADAAGSGLTESDLLSFIKERKTSNL